MRSNMSLRAVLVLSVVAVILGLAAGAARAATFSSSPTQPTVDGVDIWNFGTQTGSDKWFFQTGNEADPADWAKGQTFTTGASEVLLSALSYKIDPTANKAANTTYTIRVGMPSGTSFNQVYGETALQTVNTGVGDYMTWTFDSPVLLAPNTTYGIDVSMVSAVAWQTGIPYLSYIGNTYAGGSLYQSGPTGGSGPGPTISVDTTKDRVFHLDMAAGDLFSAYWDLNGAAAGACITGNTAPGTWGADTNWNAASNGTGTGTVAWAAGQVAKFAAGGDATGTYDVTVDGTQDIGGLIFQEGTVTLKTGTAGALRMTTNTSVDVAGGLTARIETPISDDTGGRQLIKIGNGTLVLAGDNSAATGGMAIYVGATQFESPASINGTARNVTVTSPGTVVFGASFGTIQSSLTGRIVNTSTGAIAADNHDSESLDFSSAGANFTAASLGAVGNVTYTGTLTPNGTTYRLGGGGGTLTMAGNNGITGARDLTVVGPGTVVLSAANDHTLGTTLNAGGTLLIGNAGALGSGALTIAGGAVGASGTAVTTNAVAANADFSIAGTGALTLGGTMTLNANRIITNNNTTGTTTFGAISGATRTLTFSGNGNTAVTGIIGTTTGTLTKNGTGVLTLSGANTYTGATAINGGTLALSGANGSILTTASIASIAVGTTAGPGGAMTLDNASANNTNRVPDLSTLTLNNGTINFIGNATAASTESIGAITAAKGANLINLSGGASGKVAVLTSTAGAITRTAGATLNIIVANGTSQQFKFTGGSAGINKGVFFGATAANDFAYYPGAGAAIVAPTYGSGDFAAPAATLTTLKHNKLSETIATTGAVASIYSINMPSNFSITELTGNLTFSNAADKGAIIKSGGGAAQIGTAGNAFDIVGVTAGELVIDTVASGDNLTLNVGIAASTTLLTKTGAGTLTLTANRDYLYTGATTVDAGTLVLNALNTDGFKSTAIAINNGGTVKLAAAHKVVNTAVFTVNAGGALDMAGFSDTIGGLAGSGSVTNSTGASTLTLTAGTQTFSGVIGGTGLGITVGNVVVQTLSGANTYTGPTTLTGGTLSVGASNNLGAASSNLVFDGGTLLVTGTTLTNFSGIGHTVVFNDGKTVGLNIANPFTADQVLNQGAGGLTKSGAGTLVLNQANTYTGATTVSAGTLQIGDGGTTGSLSTSSAISVAGNLTFKRSDTITQGTDFSAAAITGAGSLTKAGAGTLVLSAANAYTGATTVSAGALNVTGSLTGGGAVTLTNGTLNVTGSITSGAAVAVPASTILGIGAGGNVARGVNVSGGAVNLAGTVAGTLSVTGGTVTTSTGSPTVATADFSAGAGTVAATTPLAVTSTLKLPGGTTATLAGGTSFTAAGANLASNDVARTLSLSGGTLAFSGITGAIDLRSLASDTYIKASSYYTNDGRAPWRVSDWSGMTGTFPTATAISTTPANTMWLSNGTTGAGTYISWNFNQPYTIDKIHIWNYNEINGTYTGRGVKTLTLETSTDGSTWTAVPGLSPTIDWTNIGSNGTISGTVQSPAGGSTTYAGFDWTLPSAVTTQYLRFNNTQNFGTNDFYTGLSEVVFFPPATPLEVNLPNTSIAATASSTLDLGAASGNHTLGNLSITNGGTQLTLTGAAGLTLNSVTGDSGTDLLAGGVALSIASGNLASNITAASLTKVTGGTLALSGASTYTGATTVSGGTLDLGGGTANGSLDSTILNLGGGTFSYTRTGNTTQAFTTTNIAGGTSAISVVSGNILNLGTIVHGAGGTIDFASTGAGTVAALAASNINGIIPGATFGNTWAVANGADTAISGLAAYTRTSVALDDADNYTAANIDVDSSQAPNALITPNSLRFNTAGAYTLTLAAGANTITSGGILVNSTVGDANLSTITGGTLAGAASADLVVIQNNPGPGLTIASDIVDNTGATGLTKSGAGALTLSGANTYTGGTTLTSGKLNINSEGVEATNGPLGNGGTFTINGGTIDNTSGSAKVVLNVNPISVGGDFAFSTSAGTANNNLTLPGAVNLGAATRTITTNGAGVLTLSGIISNGGLIKDGAGELTLTGASTYTGGTTLTSGKLNINSAGVAAANGPLGNGGTFTINGGTIDNTSGGAKVVLNVNPITVGGDFAFSTSGGTVDTSLTLPGAVNLGAATRTITTNGAGVLTLSGIISNTSGGLIKDGAGTLTLTAANTYSGGTTITAGKVIASNNTALGTAAVADGATLQLNNTLGADVQLSIANAITGAGTLEFSASDVPTGADRNRTSVGDLSGFTGDISILANGNFSYTNSNATTNQNITIASGGFLSMSTVTAGGFGALNGAGTITRNKQVDSTAILTVGNGDASGAFSGIIRGNNVTDPLGLDGQGIIALTKVGAGTQTLSGANIYTGATTIDGGTLTASGASALGATTGSLAVNNPNTGAGTAVVLNLSTTDPTTKGSLTGTIATPSGGTNTATIDNGGQLFTVNQTSDGAYAGAIAGDGGFTLGSLSTNTLTLSGANTYTGPTTVIAGTLTLDYSTQNNSKLSDTAALVLGGGTLDLKGGTHTEIVGSTTLTAGTASSVTSSTPGAVLQMNTITRGAGATIDFGAASIATTDTLNTNGILGAWATIGGTDWAMNSTNDANGLITAPTYTDVTRRDGGTQVIADGSATNVRIVEGTGSPANITLGAATTTINTLNQSASGGNSAATIDPAGQTLSTNAILMGTGAGALTIGTGTNNGTVAMATPGGDLLLINNTANGLTINSAIADNATSALATTGNVLLNGVNTYTGATTVNAGTLEIGGAGQLNSGNYSAAIAVAGGATFKYNSSANQALGGAVSGAGGLAKDGAGNLTLSAVNTYTGATSVVAGTLEIGGSGQLGGGTYSNTITINPGATFKYNSSADQTLSGDGSGGVLRGGGSFIKDGDGTLTVSEDSGPDPSGNLYTGQITINKGVLKMVGEYAFYNNACTYSIASGAVLDLDCSDVTYPATGPTGTTINGAGTVRMSSPVAGGELWGWYEDEILRFELGSGGLIDLQANVSMWDYPNFGWTNNRARLNVDGALDLYKGPSVFADALTGSGTVTRTYNGTGNTLTVGVANGSGTFDGTIAGTIAFTKTGSGTQTLTGVNTYTGATTVNAGTLAVSGEGAINSTSGITVNGPTAAFMQNSSVASNRTFTLTQGTLGGTGTISTAITSGANVTIAPGDRTLGTPAAGTLNIANAVNLTGGTTEMRLFSATESDMLEQSTIGGLTYGGILKITDCDPIAFAIGNNWDLFDFDSQSGTFSNDSDFGTVGGGSTYLPPLTIGKKWSFNYTTGVLSVILGLIPGDADKNGVVDATDYITVKQNFGMTTGATWEMGNFDSDIDGNVDWDDLQLLMANFGTRTIGGAPATPEPATLGLLAIGALAVLRRRRRA